MSNKNKNQKINGNIDLDTPAMKQMRAVIVEQELSARSWKAYYEKMYYTLECEKLEPIYKEYQERMNKKNEEMQRIMEKIKNNAVDEVNKENPDGKIELSPEVPGVSSALVPEEETTEEVIGEENIE